MTAIRKKKETNLEWMERFMKESGFRELTPEEAESPEYKPSIDGAKRVLDEREREWKESRKQSK